MVTSINNYTTETPICNKMLHPPREDVMISPSKLIVYRDPINRDAAAELSRLRASTKYPEGILSRNLTGPTSTLSEILDRMVLSYMESLPGKTSSSHQKN